MPVIVPPTMSDIPPFPALSDRALGTYNSKAYAFGTHMADTFNAEFAAGMANVASNAQFAFTSAEAASTAAIAAGVFAAAAESSAASAVNSPGTTATSATSIAISVGDKVFELTESGKDFAVGQFIVSSSMADPMNNYFTGRVKAYDKPTRMLTMGVLTAAGSGTHADWSIAVGVGPNNVARVAYDDRATLRGTTPAQGASIIVSGVGLFSFVLGSTEPDDDETCFVTSSGAWLIEAVHYDLVDAYLQQIIEDVTPQVIYKTFHSTVSSITAGQRLSQVVDVPGVSVGDMVTMSENPASVIINIGSPLSGNCFFSAAVTAADTVMVYFQSPSGAGSWNALRIWDLSILKKVS